MATPKFWICLVMGNKAPASGFLHHGTMQQAKDEAERLVRTGASKSVIVLEAMFSARLSDTPISWDTLQAAPYLEGKRVTVVGERIEEDE